MTNYLRRTTLALLAALLFGVISLVQPVIVSAAEDFSRYHNVTSGGIPAGAVSAAQVIYDVAQEYGINPKVFLVLLQKEQSLLTDDWPWGRQFQIAVGYGCPDTADCNSDYYGLYNQLSNAGWQFNRYKDFPNDYQHIAGQNNSVRYHPNVSCGSSTVFIDNQATAGLYNYTPYQPNAAALSNLYGTGDACSSYGNRNFWRLYRDWFGGVPNSYDAGMIISDAEFYNDNSMTVNQIQTFLNSQLSTCDSAGAISQSYYYNSSTGQTSFSSFSGGTYVTTSRAVMAQRSYNYGGLGTPAPFVCLKDYYENKSTGENNYYKYTNSKAEVYYRTKHPTLLPGESFTSEIWYKNVGYDTWYDDIGEDSGPAGVVRTVIYTDNPIGSSSPFGYNWNSSANRPTKLLAAVYESDGSTLAADQHVVEPNQIGVYEITFDIPMDTKPGVYKHFFRPVLYGATEAYNQPDYSFITVTVDKPIYKATTYKRSKHIDTIPGTEHVAEIWFKNKGNVPWFDDTSEHSGPRNAVRTVIYTTNPYGESSPLGELWGPRQNRPTTDLKAVYESDGSTLAADQNVVEPNQIGVYEFTYKVPYDVAPIKHKTWLQPVLKGDNDAFAPPDDAFMNVTVEPADYSATTYYRTKHKTMAQGASELAEIWFENTGNMPWYDDIGEHTGPDGTVRTVLYTSNPYGTSSPLGELWGPRQNRPTDLFKAVYESDGTTLAADQHVVQPGQIAAFEFNFSVPNDLPLDKYKTWLQPVLKGDKNAFSLPDSAFMNVTVE